MVRKLEYEPIRSSATNHPVEERASGKKRTSGRMRRKRRPLDWTNGSAGTFHRVVLESGDICKQQGLRNNQAGRGGGGRRNNQVVRKAKELVQSLLHSEVT